MKREQISCGCVAKPTLSCPLFSRKSDTERPIQTLSNRRFALASVFFLSITAGALFAQPAPAAQLPSACGAGNVLFKIKTSADTSIPAPLAGMATVVFIEDQLSLRRGHLPCVGKCALQVQLGLDGQWVAATEGLSHASISVPPGDHHFCAVVPRAGRVEPLASMYGLRVEAGKVYFLRARFTAYSGQNVSILDLTQINEDEGRYLVSSGQQSIFTAP
jgi:hypothetical protein